MNLYGLSTEIEIIIITDLFNKRTKRKYNVGESIAWRFDGFILRTRYLLLINSFYIELLCYVRDTNCVFAVMIQHLVHLLPGTYNNNM